MLTYSTENDLLMNIISYDNEYDYTKYIPTKYEQILINKYCEI